MYVCRGKWDTPAALEVSILDREETGRCVASVVAAGEFVNALLRDRVV